MNPVKNTVVSIAYLLSSNNQISSHFLTVAIRKKIFTTSLLLYSIRADFSPMSDLATKGTALEFGIRNWNIVQCCQTFIQVGPLSDLGHRWRATFYISKC